MKLSKRSLIYKIKREIERVKAQTRVKVEHPVRVIKRQFGYVKTTVPWLSEKHRPSRHTVCTVEPMAGAQKTDGYGEITL